MRGENSDPGDPWVLWSEEHGAWLRHAEDLGLGVGEPYTRSIRAAACFSKDRALSIEADLNRECADGAPFKVIAMPDPVDPE